MSEPQNGETRKGGYCRWECVEGMNVDKEPPFPVWTWCCYRTSEMGKLTLRAAVGPQSGQGQDAAQGCLSSPHSASLWECSKG